LLHSILRKITVGVFEALGFDVCINRKLVLFRTPCTRTHSIVHCCDLLSSWYFWSRLFPPLYLI
jgi:hypothetical protein